MRIGVMLRALDEHGGIGVYCRNLVRELVERDRTNEYVLFYKTEKNIGAFGKFDNVTERLATCSSKAVWDQFLIPWLCYRERIDLIFHPKFTVPLLAPCKAVMTVHGADWFFPEQAQYYRWLDVRYIRVFMPLYFRKASAVISVSHLTTENFNQALGLTGDKVRTIYFAPAKHFGRVSDERRLREVRDRYALPERFILTLARLDSAARKNFLHLVQGYRRYHQETEAPLGLVIGGKDCDRLIAQFGLPADGYGADLSFPGWIAQEDLPAVYTLASMFLYPSNLEAFPIPITEAMTCGTPIITSNVNGLQEIAAEAALYVDPSDPAAIARAISRLAGDDALRDQLSAKGLARARCFSWPKCARETLRLLESVGREDA